MHIFQILMTNGNSKIHDIEVHSINQYLSRDSIFSWIYTNAPNFAGHTSNPKFFYTMYCLGNNSMLFAERG